MGQFGRQCSPTRHNTSAAVLSYNHHHHHRHHHELHPHHPKMVQIANDCKSIPLFPKRRKFSIDQNLTDVFQALSVIFSSSTTKVVQIVMILTDLESSQMFGFRQKLPDKLSVQLSVLLIWVRKSLKVLFRSC